MNSQHTINKCMDQMGSNRVFDPDEIADRTDVQSCLIIFPETEF